MYAVSDSAALAYSIETCINKWRGHLVVLMSIIYIIIEAISRMLCHPLHGAIQDIYTLQGGNILSAFIA